MADPGSGGGPGGGGEHDVERGGVRGGPTPITRPPFTSWMRDWPRGPGWRWWGRGGGGGGLGRAPARPSGDPLESRRGAGTGGPRPARGGFAGAPRPWPGRPCGAGQRHPARHVGPPPRRWTAAPGRDRGARPGLWRDAQRTRDWRPGLTAPVRGGIEFLARQAAAQFRRWIDGGWNPRCSPRGSPDEPRGPAPRPGGVRGALRGFHGGPPRPGDLLRLVDPGGRVPSAGRGRAQRVPPGERGRRGARGPLLLRGTPALPGGEGERGRSGWRAPRPPGFRISTAPRGSPAGALRHLPGPRIPACRPSPRERWATSASTPCAGWNGWRGWRKRRLRRTT